MNSLEQKTEQLVGRNGLIIFDGSCGACSTFVGGKKYFFERYGFTVSPLQEDWISELTKLDENTLLQSIHLYTPDGKILRGADFFYYFAGKVWWLKPINLLLRITICKRMFARFYEYIAKRRQRISRVCGLQSKAIYKAGRS